MFKQKIEMSGHVRMVTNGPERGRMLQGDFDNLILNQGLERIGTGAPLGACQVGTGTSAASVTQSALDSFVAGTGSLIAQSNTFVTGATPYWSCTFTYRFAEGAAAGILAEVGMGWAATGSNLFSRARILDAGGNPTTITVLSSESLDVEYTLRFYIPLTDVTGSRMMFGVMTDYVVRATDVSSGDLWGVSWFALGTPDNSAVLLCYAAPSPLGTINQRPSGVYIGGPTSSSAEAYVGNSLRLVGNANLSLSDGNAAGGIGAAIFSVRRVYNGSFGSPAAFQVSFDPPVAKTSDYLATFRFAISWARKT